MPAKTTTRTATRDKVFTAEERDAMVSRAREVKAARGGAKVDEEPMVLEKIASMQPADRAMAKRIHALIKANAPSLAPSLWYGMPAYKKDGQLICFFQDAKKFRTRYATLGFSDKARLDDGGIWPNAYAVQEMTPAVEAKIVALVKRAIG
jgi:uncharacterized protein YdhG (YjbR/CyaY superfamily)